VADLGAGGRSAPGALPVSIGGTLFNVPTAAIRMKIQRHSGPQERVDLSFVYPSLEPPDAPKHTSAPRRAEAMQPIDRIFLSIAAHHDTLAPDTACAPSIRAISSRPRTPGADGLTMRAFRDGTPYSNEDLFVANTRPHRALHPRRRDARDVPERAPHRRRRSDVPLSAQLAWRAMARRRSRQRIGQADGAIARAGG
jgi:hypothetical protein